MSLGSVIGAIGTIGGIIGGVNQWNSANKAEEMAERRAKQLDISADKRFELNSSELMRVMQSNLRSAHMETATAIFGVHQKAQEIESKLYTSTVGQGVETSSFRTDSTTLIDNGVQQQTLQSIHDLGYVGKEMIHEYNKNMQKLKIDRDDMKNDISYNLDRALADADNVRYGAITNTLEMFTSVYPTAYNYRKVPFDFKDFTFDWG